MIPTWQPDSDVSNCPVCDAQFTFWYRKHHCRYVVFVVIDCFKQNLLRLLQRPALCNVSQQHRSPLVNTENAAASFAPAARPIASRYLASTL